MQETYIKLPILRASPPHYQVVTAPSRNLHGYHLPATYYASSKVVYTPIENRLSPPDVEHNNSINMKQTIQRSREHKGKKPETLVETVFDAFKGNQTNTELNEEIEITGINKEVPMQLTVIQDRCAAVPVTVLKAPTYKPVSARFGTSASSSSRGNANLSTSPKGVSNFLANSRKSPKYEEANFYKSDGKENQPVSTSLMQGKTPQHYGANNELSVIKQTSEAVLKEREKNVIIQSELEKTKREMNEAIRRVELLENELKSREEIHMEEITEAKTRFQEQQIMMDRLNQNLMETQSLFGILNSEKQRLLLFQEENERLKLKLEKAEFELQKLKTVELEMRKTVRELDQSLARNEEQSREQLNLDRKIIEISGLKRIVENELNSIRAENQELQENLRDKANEIYRLQVERNAEKGESEKLRLQLTQKLDTLEADKHSMREEIEFIKSTIEKERRIHAGEKMTLREEFEKLLSDKLISLETEKSEKSALREELERLILDCSDKTQKWSKEKLQLSSELEAVQKKLEQRISVYETEKGTLIEERETIRKQLNSESISCIQNISERNLKIEELINRLEAALNEIARLDDANRLLLVRNEILEQEIKLKAEQILVQSGLITTPDRLSLEDNVSFLRQAAADWEKEAVKRAEQLVKIKEHVIKLEEEDSFKEDLIKKHESTLNQLLEENQRLNTVLLLRLDEISLLNEKRRNTTIVENEKQRQRLYEEDNLNKLRIMASESENAKQQIDNLMEHNQVLLGTVYQFQSRTNQLSEENGIMKNKYETLTKELNKLREDFSEYRELFKELKQANERLQTEKEISDELLISLETKLNEEKSRNANLLVEMEEIKRAGEKLKFIEIEIREKRLLEIEAEEQNRAQELLKEIEKYKFACLEIESSKSVNEYNKKSLENEIESLRAIITTDKFEIEKLYSLLELRRKDYEDIMVKAEASKTENQSLNLKLNELRAEISLLKETLEKKTLDCEKLLIDNTEISRRFQDLNIQLVNKNLELKEKNIIASDLRDKNTKLASFIRENAQQSKRTKEVLDFL